MAYVLSSISGNLISAASAGYAPTNSGDVSAIASAYQVVSATATQLYAGSSYVTSVNDAPLSASRAGNAANASLANSAWYDGTGRLISSLPDSASVSAIASSYVESGVSSKQDTLSFAYNTADQISSINGSALGGMDEAAVSGIASAYAESAVSSVSGNYYTTANESGFITGVDLTDYATTSYVDSAVSSKADSSALSSYALSADVSGTVDLVSTQSANWGGSALALSAGPGVKLEKVGDTLVASTDETLLWSGSASAGEFNLSEPKTNFKMLAFYVNDVTGYNATFNVDAASNVESFMAVMPYPNSSNAVILKYQTLSATSESSLSSIMRGRSVLVNGNSTDVATNAANCLFVTQIYGINRTAEA